ncbi:MAG: EamA family transporter [Nitrospirota bacterium]|nr:MAG: EamA family transporter [Nitrospirota bacterium]
MPYLYIIFAILLWSSLGIMVRIAGMPTHVIIFYSSSFSLLFQSVLFTRPDYRRSFPPLKKLPQIFLLSLCLLSNVFTFLFAYSKTSIANAVLTHYIAPIIVAVLAVIFLKERITRIIIISILIASAGLWTMLGGATIYDCVRSVFREGLHLSDDLIGITSGIISGVAYAVLIILARVFTQRFNPYNLVFVQNSFIVLLLLPFIRIFPADRLIIFAAMGLIHSTIAPFLYYRGLREVKASSTAVLGYLEPVGAIILSIFLLNEWPDRKAIYGGILIILSGYLVIKQRDK